MQKFLVALVLVLAACTVGATPITGSVSIAGLDTFNTTGIHFINPGVVIAGNGGLGLLKSGGFTAVDLTSFNFASAPGAILFDWNHLGVDVTMKIISLSIVEENAHFLNIAGESQLTFTGETPTDFLWTLSSTHPDGLTSYSMDITAVPEPTSLLFLGTGLVGLAMVSKFRRGGANRKA